MKHRHALWQLVVSQMAPLPCCTGGHAAHIDANRGAHVCEVATQQGSGSIAPQPPQTKQPCLLHAFSCLAASAAARSELSRSWSPLEREPAS